MARMPAVLPALRCLAIAGPVLALTKGVLTTMLLGKLTSALGVVLVTLLLGAGILMDPAVGHGERTQWPVALLPVPEPKAPDSKTTLREALAQEVPFPGFDDTKTTLGDAVDYFAKHYRLPLTIDEKALRDEGILGGAGVASARALEIAEHRPIPPQQTQAYYAVERILRRVPSPSGLVLVVRDRSVEITTQQAAQAAKVLPEPAPPPNAAAVQRTRRAEAFLKDRVNFPGCDDPKTTLGEALGNLAARHQIQFDTLERAFKDEQVFDVLKTEIAAPNVVPAMPNATGAQILATILARIPVPSGATYVLRPSGAIEINTKDYLKAEAAPPK